MKSDWYNTLRAGTYLVVPAGTALSTLDLPEGVASLLDTRSASPFAEDVESHVQALIFERAGVDDCLKHTGYCVVR